MVTPVSALVSIPESLSAAEAAPLLCAGITTYNALRHSGALPGDLVAVQEAYARMLSGKAEFRVVLTM